MTEICQSELTEWLPHRSPILLPEQIRIIEPGRSGLGKVRLDASITLWDEETHQDFAQVLVLESAAQVLGVVLATKTASSRAAEGTHLLLGLDEVTFGEALLIGQEFEVTVELERSLGTMHRACFVATQTGRCLAAGRLSVMQG